MTNFPFMIDIKQIRGANVFSKAVMDVENYICNNQDKTLIDGRKFALSDLAGHTNLSNLVTIFRVLKNDDMTVRYMLSEIVEMVFPAFKKILPESDVPDRAIAFARDIDAKNESILKLRKEIESLSFYDQKNDSIDFHKASIAAGAIWYLLFISMRGNGIEGPVAHKFIIERAIFIGVDRIKISEVILKYIG